jgi:TolB-like protein
MAEERTPTAERAKGAAATPAGDLASLAILPFRDLSPGQDEGHFCEGIADEILLGLNRAEGLRVLSRTSSFLFKDADLPPEAIGRRLGVRHALGGTLRKEGSRLDLEAELVEAATGRRVWTGRFEGHGFDLFDTVEAVVQAVAARLGTPCPGHPRQPVDLEAYDLYLRGRQAYFHYNRHGMLAANRLFERALDLDPAYAAAWAGLANCAAYLYIYVDRSESHRDRAERASLRALELDPDLAEAHAAHGAALSAAGRDEEAGEAFETALRLDPNLYEAAYFYARHCFAAGRMEEAVQYFEWAAALRPEDFQAVLLVAQAYANLGVPDEAERARRQGLALAQARLEHCPDDARARYFGANALVALGQREKGLAWARMARGMDPGDSMLLYNLGCIHALAEDPEAALNCLTQAVRAGLTQTAWLRHDGDLASLREHPRFLALLRSIEAGEVPD